MIGVKPTDRAVQIKRSGGGALTAAVNKNGSVYEKKPGIVTITAPNELCGLRREAMLRIRLPAAAVDLADHKAVIRAYRRLDITATAIASTDTYENRLLTFTISDGQIVRADGETGVAYGAATGMATIITAAVNDPGQVLTVPGGH